MSSSTDWHFAFLLVQYGAVSEEVCDTFTDKTRMTAWPYAPRWKLEWNWIRHSRTRFGRLGSVLTQTQNWIGLQHCADYAGLQWGIGWLCILCLVVHQPVFPSTQWLYSKAAAWKCMKDWGVSASQGRICLQGAAQQTFVKASVCFSVWVRGVYYNTCSSRLKRGVCLCAKMPAPGPSIMRTIPTWHVLTKLLYSRFPGYILFSERKFSNSLSHPTWLINVVNARFVHFCLERACHRATYRIL